MTHKNDNFIPHHYNTLKSNPYFSNVRCTEDDVDITTCPGERENEFENSCTHEHDVGLRCHESSWAGVRLGVLAERADLQFITVERAGLLDYSTNIFKPGETWLLLYYMCLWLFLHVTSKVTPQEWLQIQNVACNLFLYFARMNTFCASM